MLYILSSHNYDAINKGLSRIIHYTFFRLGSVPVKESSVIIAISSPHRAEAMKATEWCIDNLKKSVPIWKKEIYEDEAPEWKENKECMWSSSYLQSN